MSRRKIRSVLLPKQDGATPEEWSASPLFYDHAALRSAYPILKILLAPAWVTLTHTHDKSQKVLHVLRPPEGFVQSWFSRYVIEKGGGPEQVFKDNLPSLQVILEQFERTSDFPNSFSTFNLVVSELWRWRYMNELLIERLCDSSRYMLITYQDLMTERVASAERIFTFAGLQMNDASRHAIEAMQNTLFAKRQSDGLDPVLVSDAIAQVLGESAHYKTLSGAM